MENNVVEEVFEEARKCNGNGIAKYGIGALIGAGAAIAVQKLIKVIASKKKKTDVEEVVDFEEVQ